MLRRAPPTPSPVPYTTLFRSRLTFARKGRGAHDRRKRRGIHRGGPAAGGDGSHRLSRGLGRGEGGRSCRLGNPGSQRSEEHTSELQSRSDLVCRLLLEKKKHP